MGLRAIKDENQVLELLEDMSYMAKSAKKIEELADAMDHIATQTTLLALDAAVIKQSSKGLVQLGTAVKDASEEMHSQFELLLAEVTELEKFIKRQKMILLKESGLN